jgi:MFS family permease
MAVPAERTAGPVDKRNQRHLVHAVVASTVGSTIAWYDFFLYGFAATSVFGSLFFPSGNSFVSTLAALTTYVVGFAARPVGAALFGRLGDRIGRRATLIATLLLMGLVTPLIGLVPTYSQAGILGGILLALLRVVQGIGAGGEWAGSVLLPIEWGHRGRRGLVGSLPQVGIPVGLALAYGSLHLFTTWLGTDAGWRVPFLLGVLLVAAGVYIRLGVMETPVFTGLLEARRIEEAPVSQVVVRQWREVVLTALLRTGQQTPFALLTVFVIGYATGTLKLAQADVTNAILVAAAVSIVTVPFWGFLSDVFGRKRLVMLGAAAMLLWSYPFWRLLDTGTPLLAFLAIVAFAPIHDIQHGPQAAFIAESFTGRLRYSGASLGYQLGSLTADGPVLLIPFALQRSFGGSLPFAIYMIVCAAISLLAAAALKDRSRQDMAIEYDEPATAAPPAAMAAAQSRP